MAEGFVEAMQAICDLVREFHQDMLAPPEVSRVDRSTQCFTNSSFPPPLLSCRSLQTLAKPASPFVTLLATLACGTTTPKFVCKGTSEANFSNGCAGFHNKLISQY